jgi:toxin HigB-1
MIKTIKHKGLKLFYSSNDKSKLPPDMIEKIRDILTSLDQADSIEHMDRPYFRLHALKGNMNGFYAATVRANWRIIFKFEDGNAYDVELIDYH